MGQARQRGTYEQRKAKAEQEQREATRRRVEDAELAERHMTPEEMARQRKARALLALTAGIIAGHHL